MHLGTSCLACLEFLLTFCRTFSAWQQAGEKTNHQPETFRKILPAPDDSAASEASGSRRGLGNSRQAAKKHQAGYKSRKKPKQSAQKKDSPEPSVDLGTEEL